MARINYPPIIMRFEEELDKLGGTIKLGEAVALLQLIFEEFEIEWDEKYSWTNFREKAKKTEKFDLPGRGGKSDKKTVTLLKEEIKKEVIIEVPKKEETENEITQQWPSDDDIYCQSDFEKFFMAWLKFSHNGSKFYVGASELQRELKKKLEFNLSKVNKTLLALGIQGGQFQVSPGKNGQLELNNPKLITSIKATLKKMPKPEKEKKIEEIKIKTMEPKKTILTETKVAAELVTAVPGIMSINAVKKTPVPEIKKFEPFGFGDLSYFDVLRFEVILKAIKYIQEEYGDSTIKISAIRGYIFNRYHFSFNEEFIYEILSRAFKPLNTINGYYPYVLRGGDKVQVFNIPTVFKSIQKCLDQKGTVYMTVDQCFEEKILNETYGHDIVKENGQFKITTNFTLRSCMWLYMYFAKYGATYDEKSDMYDYIYDSFEEHDEIHTRMLLKNC